MTPVVAVGIAGTWLLYRAGRRHEALLIAGVSGLFLVYNAAYYVPFGGFVPGPRFLIPVLPFIALGIAAAFKAWPMTTAALAAVQRRNDVGHAAEPLLGSEDTRSWLRRAENGDFTHTVVTLLGDGHGWIATMPFLLFVATAATLATRQIPLSHRRAEVGLAAGAVLGWLILLVAAPDLLSVDRAVGQWTGAVAVALLAVALSLVLAALAKGHSRALLALLPHAILLLPDFARHSKWSIIVITGTLGLLAVAARLRTSRTQLRT